MKKILATLAIAIAASTSASASTMKVTQQDPLFGAGNLSKSISIKYNGTAKNVRAGMFHLTGEGIGNFAAFCIDLAQYLGNPQMVSTWVDPFNATVRNNVDKLFSNVVGSSTMLSAITDQVTAAGFQIALWEIIYDSANGFDLAGGSFKRNGGVSDMAWTRAGEYLADLSKGSMGKQTLTYYYSEENQDLVTGNPTPVPLPASGLLILAGMGGFAALRRRKAA